MGSVIRVTACIVLGALVGACSSGGGSEGKGIPTDVATALAARADRVAADLDAGACDQALTEAHSLQTDVGALKVQPAVRGEAVAGAARLVAGINCAPPTTVAQDSQPGGGEPGPGKGKKHGHGNDNGD